MIEHDRKNSIKILHSKKLNITDQTVSALARTTLWKVNSIRLIVQGALIYK